jgi:hypothetical protein
MSIEDPSQDFLIVRRAMRQVKPHTAGIKKRATITENGFSPQTPSGPWDLGECRHGCHSRSQGRS